MPKMVMPKWPNASQHSGSSLDSQSELQETSRASSKWRQIGVFEIEKNCKNAFGE